MTALDSKGRIFWQLARIEVTYQERRSTKILIQGTRTSNVVNRALTKRWRNDSFQCRAMVELQPDHCPSSRRLVLYRGAESQLKHWLNDKNINNTISAESSQEVII